MILDSRGFECVDQILGFFKLLILNYHFFFADLLKVYMCTCYYSFWVISNARFELLWLSFSSMCFGNEK